MSLLETPPAVDTTALQQPAESAPSPVPTEIIPSDLTQEEIVVDIQQLGIKVRDFAYEQFPSELRAPELFDPILGWHVYETVLDNPDPERSPLNGRHLRRLLDLGWVLEEAERHRWEEKDREALEEFDSQPQYPWKALGLTKPKKHDLRDVATSRFQWVNAEQLVPQFVNRRGFTRVLRVSRHTAARYQKRQVIDSDATETETDQDLNLKVSPRLKKRRLSLGADSAASPGHSTSSSPSPSPLTVLVNGKPPQQFPAGHLTESPSRLPPLPTQGALSRSLQRHLSMSSVDVRTTITQRTNHE